MKINQVVAKASKFGISVYSINEEETEFYFSTTWEIPCKIEKKNDLWTGYLFSSHPAVADKVIHGNLRYVSEKCLDFCLTSN